MYGTLTPGTKGVSTDVDDVATLSSVGRIVVMMDWNKMNRSREVEATEVRRPTKEPHR
jgi:hypothetical protein